MVTVQGSATVGSATFNPTASITLPSSGGGYPAAVDRGNTLAAYIDAAAAGQVVVIPQGKTLTAGTIQNKNKSSWAFVMAEVPGSVTLSDTPTLSNVTNVVLGGIKMPKNFTANIGSIVGLWYCDVSQGSSGIAAVNTVVSSGTSRAAKLLLFGTDVHDSALDGCKSNIDNFGFQGGRMWNIHDPSGVNHDDCLQSQQGQNQFVADAVFGMTKAGVGSDNGHSQIQADQGPVSITYTNVWITSSGNFAITADDKGAHPLVMTATGCRAWANNFGNGSTLINKAGTSVSGTSITSSGTIFAAPTGSDTPPDVAWQAANPYTTAVSWFANK